MGEAFTRHSLRPLVISRADDLNDSGALRRGTAACCSQLLAQHMRCCPGLDPTHTHRLKFVTRKVRPVGASKAHHAAWVTGRASLALDDSGGRGVLFFFVWF